MNVKRTLKIIAVVVCNPHMVLASVILTTINILESLIDKLDDALRNARNWMEGKAESAPIFAKKLSDQLQEESNRLQRKKAAKSTKYWVR
ncbi:hypothetical protein [Rouxiella sp. Mn2063]|uniref:hypothetical protein n=1 Tax=Rouxiella sp. Mn2063 TaxID=3395262 RepID=UPI003BCE1FE7